ncbi:MULTISPECIES: KTSC domain-containing protein [Paenibacillus]|uniref:KTSC domain-containing protein n=1 Tax=Paenibacillus TaxID=44249 RepID=UPI0022B87904|nr:KTSC domain-containing protein [Paenibacillus caseinilyticus]MCZ8522382.1 KTSC domain-containing protein [Paenibacillus caseinilyticus]
MDVKWIGYNPETRELCVKFHSGTVYIFIDVPVAVYDGLLNATAKGHYLWTQIKEFYPFRQIV